MAVSPRSMSADDLHRAAGAPGGSSAARLPPRPEIPSGRASPRAAAGLRADRVELVGEVLCGAWTNSIPLPFSVSMAFALSCRLEAVNWPMYFFAFVMRIVFRSSGRESYSFLEIDGRPQRIGKRLGHCVAHPREPLQRDQGIGGAVHGVDHARSAGRSSRR